jgi:hypothetical protein
VTHSALSWDFEKALQAIDPSLALHYWVSECKCFYIRIRNRPQIRIMFPMALLTAINGITVSSSQTSTLERLGTREILS